MATVRGGLAARVRRAVYQVSTILKGRFILWGLDGPTPVLPDYDVRRFERAHAIAVNNVGQRFIISRDEETKDWLLFPLITQGRADFSAEPIRFPKS